MVPVSAMTEPLAQMRRLVGSRLKFCKQRLNYECHNLFSTLKFEMAENKIQIYKMSAKVVFRRLYVDTRFFIGK